MTYEHLVFEKGSFDPSVIHESGYPIVKDGKCYVTYKKLTEH